MRKEISTVSVLLVLSLLAGGAAHATRDPLSAAPIVAPADTDKVAKRPAKALPVTADEVRAEIRRYQTDLVLKPNDAPTHYKLAEVYRKANELGLACDEYLKAIHCDQNYWVAYHQLLTTSTDQKQVDEVFEKLTKLEAQKPAELLLRVALSEYYEKRGNYYQAARTLVDCTFNGGVPEKWRVRVNARIHNMLVLAKSQKLQPDDPAAASAATANAAPAEEDLDVMPAPIPTPSSKRSIAQAKLKDAKEVRGMGNTPLLP